MQTTTQADREHGGGTSRVGYLDHIKVFLPLRVIVRHLAAVFIPVQGEASPRRHRPSPAHSHRPTGFCFLIAVYFVPASFGRKGAARFLEERTMRLLIPTAMLYLSLSQTAPLLTTVFDGAPYDPAIYRANLSTGLLWFTLLLFIFSALYLAARVAGVRMRTPFRAFSSRNIVIAAGVLCVSLFAFRTAVPIFGWVFGMERTRLDLILPWLTPSPFDLPSPCRCSWADCRPGAADSSRTSPAGGVPPD